jgi:hypothetical protein
MSRAFLPFETFLGCYQVLRANQDGRAVEILNEARNLLLKQAQDLPDAEAREAFLGASAARRALLGDGRR